MKLADLSGKRANRAMGAFTQREKAQIEHSNQPPKREIPMELAPATFDHRVELTKDDEQDEDLQRARRKFITIGDQVKNWLDREVTIWSNEFELDAKKRMLVSEMVDKEFSSGIEDVHAAHKDLGREIANIEKRIDAAFRNRLKIDEAREIRQHVKAMTKSERATFLSTADEDVVASVLAAKPFLSGLGDAEAAMLRQQTVARWFPGEITRRAKLERAQQMLEAGLRLRHAAAQAMIDKNLKRFKEQAAAMQAAAAGTA